MASGTRSVGGGSAFGSTIVAASEARGAPRSAGAAAGGGGGGGGGEATGAVAAREMDPAARVAAALADPAMMEKYLEWKKRREEPHPLYTTQTMDYGKVPVGYVHHLEAPKAGKNGAFTKEHGRSGPPRDAGLRTGATRHRFLPDLDGLL